MHLQTYLSVNELERHYRAAREPSELLGIENQLLADGAAWEEGVPTAASFTLHIRLVLQEDSMRDSEIPAETTQ